MLRGKTVDKNGRENNNNNDNKKLNFYVSSIGCTKWTLDVF